MITLLNKSGTSRADALVLIISVSEVAKNGENDNDEDNNKHSETRVAYGH